MGLGSHLLAWTAAVEGLACRVRPAASLARPATGQAPPPHYYAVPEATDDVLSDQALGRGRRVEVRRLLLRPGVPEDLRWIAHADQPIEVTLHRPLRAGTGPLPLVLLSPILEHGTLCMPQIASVLARHGLMSALVHRKDVTLNVKAPIEQAEAEMRLLVLRSRQALGTLLRVAAVDPSRLATFGLSAGSMVSAMLAGAEPRFAAHAWAFAGGPMADVMVDTVEPRFRRYMDTLRRAGGWTRTSVRERLRSSLRTDPVGLAAGVRRDDVLLFLAQLDTSVRVRHGWTLYHALGRPALRLLPLGHRASFAFLPYVLLESVRFLHERFEARGAAARAD